MITWAGEWGGGRGRRTNLEEKLNPLNFLGHFLQPNIPERPGNETWGQFNCKIWKKWGRKTTTIEGGCNFFRGGRINGARYVCQSPNPLQIRFLNKLWQLLVTNQVRTWKCPSGRRCLRHAYCQLQQWQAA